MSDRLNIEQLINSRLGEARIDPSPGSWNKIQRKLRWKQFLMFRPGQMNIFYLAGLLVTGGAVVTLVYTSSPEEQPTGPASVAAGSPSTAITVPEEPEAAPAARNPLREERTGVAGPGVQDAQPEVVPPAKTTEQETGQVPSTPGATEIQPDQESPDEPEESPRVQNTVVAYFTSSVRSGCAPLTVAFRNQTINETASYWSFGEDEIVTERDPVYRFSEPGEYRVLLTAENSEGQVFTYSQVIEVFPTPRAEFEIEEGVDGLDGLKALSFMNYSAGAFSYSWSLVKKSEVCSDNWTSNEFQPSLSMADLEPESCYIRLLATNEYGCTDTSLQALPFSSGVIHPALQFPTAFSPNPNGPGGGIYSPHEIRNDLFHPVFEREPDQYLLTVFSRTGETIFTTMNIYQGWDGYYKQEQSSGGVYLWVAEGTWDNGEEFKFRGDVTLLWGE